MAAPRTYWFNSAILHDTDGNVIDSILLAGVRRLRVESVGGGGSAALNTFTAAAPAVVVVGVVSTALVGANAARKYLAIGLTTSGGRISLNIAAGAAVLNSGITIFTASGHIFDAAGLPTAAVNAIADAGARNVWIQEGS